MPEPHIGDVVSALLEKSGRNTSPVDIEPCQKGGNNKVYVVKTKSERFIAKQYFTSAEDVRDRLRAEWEFLIYAEKAGIDCVPRTIVFDPQMRVALFEFIEGRKITAPEVGRQEIEAAADFFFALNNPQFREAATGLKEASEACFSVGDHVARIDQRLERLDRIDLVSRLDREAAAFVEDLVKYWEMARDGVGEALSRRGINRDDLLPMAGRCVSPSDFGFHNAIQQPNGKIVFIDFEYAGWDDPAKFVADFFCQPAVPVDVAHVELFLALTLGRLDWDQSDFDRARILWPIFEIKWCCIMLNAFVPEWMERRRFADKTLDENSYKREQLVKAKARLTQIVERGSPWPI